MTIQDLVFRQATLADLDAIIHMLSDDELGSKREHYSIPLPEGYVRAFHAIDADPNHELIVAELSRQPIGVLQIIFTPHLTYQGGWRATIEGVRTSQLSRGKGVGSALFGFAIQRAKDRGCQLVQLTTDRARPDALKFYERLGFKATHEGLKLHL